MINVRTPSQLGPKIFGKQPVWEFMNDDEHPAGDTAMRPVRERPVRSFDDRLFGTKVTLADGTALHAMISGLGFRTKKYRHHFRLLTIFAKGKRFHVANYYQFGYRTHGPAALAAFLGKRTKDVFPITYDLTGLAEGASDIVRGTFEAKIKDPIPRDKVMGILVASLKV